MREDFLISEEDMKDIESIAEKYNVTVQELGRILTRKNSYPRLQILLYSDEANEIDIKCSELNLTRSKYCSMCCKKALQYKLYENLDVIKIAQNTIKNQKREHRAVISFDSAKDYKTFKQIASELGVKFSSLMRYLALNVEL